MTRRERNRTLVLLAAFVAASVVFTAWPEIDLWVSGLFYADGKGFPLADNHVISVLRHAIRIVMTLTPVATLLMLLATALGVRPFGVPPQLWAFVTLLFVAGPLLVVNLGFKNLWGRARPSEVMEFGGEAVFTPALRITDECARNCSFVSGEGAGATALAITMILLAPYLLARLSARLRRRVLGWALVAPAIALVLRVATGRHFLSDTVFAVLIVLAIAAALSPLLLSGLPRHGQRPR